MVRDLSSVNQFNQRIRRLDRKHRAMSNGYSSKIRSDGLIVVRPRRAPVRLPITPILIAVVSILLFKGLLLASIGGPSYLDRLAGLQAGSVLERAGAWVMQIDPVSAFVAEKVAPVLP